ncbi:hypothetical protein BU17DRAFT_72220 [Hysterangium stoloniferum]|nr:hypothetical protein BU17DRAFT_72220 [Hysterangium stoloniferum]
MNGKTGQLVLRRGETTERKIKVIVSTGIRKQKEQDGIHVPKWPSWLLGLVSQMQGNKKDTRCTPQHDVIWSLCENGMDAVMHEWEDRRVTKWDSHSNLAFRGENEMDAVTLEWENRPTSVEAGSNYEKKD